MDISTSATAGAGAASGGSGAGTGAGAPSSGAGVTTTPSTPNGATGAGNAGTLPGTGTVVDGNQGAGALDHSAAVEAMVAAAAAKGFGVTEGDGAATTPETPAVDGAVIRR
jgi:hypothetical protein